MLRICLLSVLAVTAAHGTRARLVSGEASSQPSNDGFASAVQAGYQKGKRLGEGKSGVVHMYTKDEEKFAVKKSLSPSTKADLVKESKMLQKLQAIGVRDVPTCVALFENDDFVEVVMGVARGKDLQKVRSINLEQAHKILRSIASVAASIHANGIVHCDFHQQNVKVYIPIRGNEVETTAIDWAGYKTGLKDYRQYRKTDAKKFANLAAFTFDLAGADTKADAARAVMNTTSTAFALLYKHSDIHMWRKEGKLWTPIYDENRDDLSAWTDVTPKSKKGHFEGACYNIFKQGSEKRKVWVSDRACKRCQGKKPARALW